MIANNVITQFSQHFRLLSADTPELLREVYRMRYEVYCVEMGFERPEQFPDGLERDDYDHRARHCLLQHRASGLYAGSVRLVLHDQKNSNGLFPFEKHCGHSLNRSVLDPMNLPREQIGEISRLTVTAQFRRRQGDNQSTHGSTAETINGSTTINGPTVPAPEIDRRIFSHIAAGLYLAGAAMGLQQGLSGVFVMMEPRLARHLSFYDLHFTPVGEVIEYHGRRRGPYYISREDVLQRLSPPLTELMNRIRSELAQKTQPTRRAGHAHPQTLLYGHG